MDDDEPLDESYFSSHPASATASIEPDALEPDASFSSASSTSSSPDSLADASFSTIEARALEFLGTSPPSTGPVAGFRLEDLPRPVPPTPHERDEAHAAALDFLRQSLDEADKDEWRYRTPAVFAAPSAAAPSAGAGARTDALNVGLDDAAAQPWQDRAFNPERWEVEGLEAVDAAGADAPPLEALDWSGRFDEGEAGFMT
ncbi:hypothetical protein DMC30DRAFT_304109 [Rhodotorula diobovata]|uniref:Uncharacterized protein n=1 Tax=Rhodotorula diobovata TaxID=5288 RepID=A0A5C5FT93_9BASI|nr:hypothetical protein DMC30DRAFT_304109 [Rhodotorula diobovata]